MQTYYCLVVTKYFTEQDAEIGREYKNTGRKDKDGNDIWDYTPSLRGPKDTQREVLRIVADTIDIVGLARLLDRKYPDSPISAA